uniref:protein lifeguard 2-like isoform X2 n=1 Tax=Doryrhamphus excisus TaxID=161450 RepID=UPI0025AE17C0|nr:protein lifeguard 2-like isoform X2 [Doryrhamphus excisus]
MLIYVALLSILFLCCLSWVCWSLSQQSVKGAGEASSNDVETLREFTWDDRNIRRVFIRKVYTILMIQLLVTLAVVSIFTFCDPLKDYIQSNPGWYWASYGVFFVTYLTLSCCSAPRRRFPWNLILLAIFTLSLIYMTGMLSRYWFLLPLISQKVSDFALNLSNQFMNSNLLLFSVYSRYIVYCRQSFYNTKSVMICLGITTAVCLLVTILSFQTKVDVTSYQGVLLIFCMVMFISGLVPWLDTTYAVLGAILFTMFLAFDTQLLMGNKRYTMSPEEYIFATLSIYLDIVYIFSFFLQIFGTRQE